MALPEIFSKLNDGLKEEFDITLFSVLKTVFDSAGYASMEPDAVWDALDAMSMQSKYEDKINLFLHPEYKKKGKANKIAILKEFYDYLKDKVVKMVDNEQSSFYCLNCMQKTTEDNGLFDWIRPEKLDDLEHANCDNNTDGPLAFSTPTQLIGTTFSGIKDLNLTIHPSGDHLLIEFADKFNDVPKGSIVKAKRETLVAILRYWYKTTLLAKTPAFKADAKLFTYSVDATINRPMINVTVPDEGWIFDKSKLSNDDSAIGKECRKILGERMKGMSNEQFETAVTKWSKKKFDGLDYWAVKNRYFPDVSDADLLFMAAHESILSQALEGVQKDAKGSKLVVPVVS